MTVLDLCGDWFDALLREKRYSIEVADVLLGPSELRDAVRWARGHDGTGGHPDAAPPWWAQVVFELREQRREDREERIREGSVGQ